MFGLESKNENVWMFTPLWPVNTQRWHVFIKKKGVKFYTFICVGAGAAGGNGFSAAAGAARGGGGGGGSGAISRLRIHASFLPEVLYMIPGVGGRQGGTTSGEISIIALNNRFTTANASITLLRSGAGNAGVGGTGTGAAAGAAGSAGTIETNAGCPYSAWGEFISIAGNAGVLGGAQTGAVGVSQTAIALPIIGGAGGAGVTTTDFAGGAINISSGFIHPVIAGGLAAGGDGRNGTRLDFPLRFLSGSGGGSNNSGVGGKGGNGALGCGGGGGGGGVTGGTGGNGGDGFIIVIEEY